MKRWTDLSESEIAAKSAANRAARQAPVKNSHPPVKSLITQGKITELVLPYPPTVNHYWLPNANHSKRISAKGLKFRADVIHACRGISGVMGRVGVHVEAFPPDKRKRDLDNLFKALLDALSHAGMIEDDSLIDALSIERFEVAKGGKVIVTITPRYP